MQRKKILYWTLQIVTWSLLVSNVAFNYYSVSGNPFEFKVWQLIVSYTIFIFLIIFYTHQTKRLLNKVIHFDALKVKDIFKILGIVLLAVLLLTVSREAYLKILYTWVYNRAEVYDHPGNNYMRHVSFITTYFLCFIIWTVFYVAIKGLIELNESRETRLKLEANLRDSQLNTLKGQINPHFMFNSLNNIRGLMLEDVARARNMLTSLSEILRYSLTKSTADAIALEDELEMVRNFVEISRIQYEDRLQFEEDIDADALIIQIPPMIIQMLVENALKHGIAKLKEGGLVSLTVRAKETELCITVSNTGTIKNSESGTQVGLKNIQQRLELLYGTAASFTLETAANMVIATIKMPIL